mmetsp:Transcript_88271/g.189488  ORF Transcript_88271/g.189488 Transcript_88271/m.189488 type:complete len:463 (-) Transcript_88271:75-1463(-)
MHDLEAALENEDSGQCSLKDGGRSSIKELIGDGMGPEKADMDRVQNQGCTPSTSAGEFSEAVPEHEDRGRSSFKDRLNAALSPEKLNMDVVNNRGRTPSPNYDFSDDTVGSLRDFSRLVSTSSNYTPGGRVRRLWGPQRSISNHSEEGLTSPSRCSASSNFRFSEPTQTLIVFDWDDTLFPTTELFDRMRFSSKDKEAPKWAGPQEHRMAEWREALRSYINEAFLLSDMVAIISNSRRPWITTCIERFAPDLKPLFEGPKGVKIMYAFEHLPEGKTLRSQCMNLRPVKHRELDMIPSQVESEEEMTHAKYAAMKVLAADFYSQYPGQTWKNLISLGDMRYEHDAMQELTFRRMLGSSNRKEKIRTKTIILPPEPTLSEITLRLRFSRHMLKAYVSFNGDLDVDLSTAADPLVTLAEALGIEGLKSVAFSRHAWGRRTTPPDSEEAMADLADVEVAVHNALYD